MVGVNGGWWEKGEKSLTDGIRKVAAAEAKARGGELFLGAIYWIRGSSDGALEEVQLPAGPVKLGTRKGGRERHRAFHVIRSLCNGNAKT